MLFMVERDDVLDTIEWAKKRHFQGADGGLSNEIRTAFSLFPDLGLIVITAIQHGHSAVVAKAIAGADIAQAAFKGIIQQRNPGVTDWEG